MTCNQLAMVTLVCALATFGCTEEKINRAADAPAASAAPVDRKAIIAGAAGAPTAGSSTIAKIDFQEIEFGESERSRDPFRSFEETFVSESRSTAKSQRQVIAMEYSIDELKLVGIVTGVPDAKAMLIDPHGKGHVLQRGQFVGRAEIVHGDSKGAPAFEVNWRVDRIRDGDIVLVREDPKNPEVPSATRIIPLRAEPKDGLEGRAN